MAHQTLLTRIAPKLHVHSEQVAVEALLHILSSSAAARRTLGDTLQRGGARGGPIVRATTRSTGETEELAILTAFDDQGVERVSIEARFWRGQPVACFDQPPHDQPPALLFVVPDARYETLRAELGKRAQEAASESSSVSERTEPWSAAMGDGRRLMLISWKALLGRMSAAANTEGETQTEFDIRQLREFTKQQQEETAFLPLRSDELGPRFPRRMRSLRRLIGDAAARASNEGWAIKGGQSHRGGYYVPLQRSGVTLRLGIGLDLWAHHGITPLWVTVHVPDSLTVNEARRRINPLLVDDDAWLPSVPIKLPVHVEYDKVRDAVVAQLQNIAGRLARDPGSQS